MNDESRKNGGRSFYRRLAQRETTDADWEPVASLGSGRDDGRSFKANGSGFPQIEGADEARIWWLGGKMEDGAALVAGGAVRSSFARSTPTAIGVNSEASGRAARRARGREGVLP